MSEYDLTERELEARWDILRDAIDAQYLPSGHPRVEVPSDPWRRVGMSIAIREPIVQAGSAPKGLGMRHRAAESRFFVSASTW